nr:immunoglobulin light chain junction region [Macaca mulatta]MOX11924.1 immunoglobulin light chain junction region [Macaca mulatta]MOX12402.1 immunoglobulin light chain junction region [Macaca mulatta]MOX12442.1 immunoglobulin light chain junction region [Macaca mulatta]MOX13212.1 immunoglobulin light chain junction region [Macaca mulatta]
DYYCGSTSGSGSNWQYIF